MSTVVSIVLAILLIAANAFFNCAEFALISARRDRLEALAAKGITRANTVIEAGRDISLMLAGAQFGITLASLGLGALAEPTVASWLEHALSPLRVPPAIVHPTAFAIGLIVVSILHIVLGEMVPKNIAIAGPERSAILLVPVHLAFVRLVRPVIVLLNWIAGRVLRLLKVEPKDEIDTAYTPDELAGLIGESRREGLLDASEHRRLAKTLSSAARTVADVLVPLADITTVPQEPTVGDVENAVASTGFSRFPTRAADGRLTGYLHVKDVLDQAESPPSTPVPTSKIRGLPALPADAGLGEAVAALRRAQSHLAAAVTVAGDVLGVVALEDLVEEYVGTVRDGTHVAGFVPRVAR